MVIVQCRGKGRALSHVSHVLNNFASVPTPPPPALSHLGYHIPSRVRLPSGTKYIEGDIVPAVAEALLLLSESFTDHRARFACLVSISYSLRGTLLLFTQTQGKRVLARSQRKSEVLHWRFTFLSPVSIDLVRARGGSAHARRSLLAPGVYCCYSAAPQPCTRGSRSRSCASGDTAPPPPCNAETRPSLSLTPRV